MASTINATPTSSGLISTADNSGVLELQTGGTTAVSIDGSQVFKFNNGYGSVATAYGCRAWVSFNGSGTVAIRSSGNVSSITDNATGNYTVNFATAMSDANYSTTVSYSQNYGIERCIGAQINQGASGNEQAPTTTAFRFITTGATSEYDSKYVCVAIFR